MVWFTFIVCLVVIFVVIAMLSLGWIVFTNKLDKDIGSSCNKACDCSPGLACFAGKCKCVPGTSCKSNNDCGGINSKCTSGVCVSRD